MSEICMVYITASGTEEAERIARTVVQEHLAACANIMGSIRSIYHWEGKLEQGTEVALLLKTQRPIVDALVGRVRELHSYSCPAIVVLPVQGGFGGFLEWVRTETADPILGQG
jgi:periplasmic divalent cation tolerance protein